MTDKQAEMPKRKAIARALFEHWKTINPNYSGIEYNQWYEDRWIGFADAIRALSSFPSTQLLTPTYCAHCAMEHQLHEDAQGFHHVIKGERVSCPSQESKP